MISTKELWGLILNEVMTREEKYLYWFQLAQYDLESADTMCKGGRWFYVAFMCQQAMEKLCKGLYNFYVDDNVPKVHNIRFILSKIETMLSITVDASVYQLADSLSAYYLHNRYPDFVSRVNLEIDENHAVSILEKTKGAFEWLLTLKK